MPPSPNNWDFFNLACATTTTASTKHVLVTVHWSTVSHPTSFATCVDHGLYHCVGLRQTLLLLIVIWSMPEKTDWARHRYCFSSALQDSWLLQFAHSCLQTTVDYPSCKWQHPSVSYSLTGINNTAQTEDSFQFPLITISSHYLQQEIFCCCLLIILVWLHILAVIT